MFPCGLAVPQDKGTRGCSNMPINGYPVAPTLLDWPDKDGPFRFKSCFQLLYKICSRGHDYIDLYIRSHQEDVQ